MDLPYPSMNDKQFAEKFGQIESKTPKKEVTVSFKLLPPVQELTNSNKNRLLSLIRSDRAYSLYSYLEKEMIKLDSEIGTKGSSWNSLHYCAKYNSYECMDFALKWEYQNRPENYECLLEHRTSEGYTPLMIAIINGSQECLMALLKYGGTDLGACDANRLTAYDHATQANNQLGLQLLMRYEKKASIESSINKAKLTKDFVFSHKNEGCCYELTEMLSSCFSFGCKREDKRNRSGIKRISSVLNMESYFVDVVPFGQPYLKVKFPCDNEVEWMSACDLYKAEDCQLFDKYHPFGIKETQVSLPNCLPLLQALCQHPWLVRKAIQSNKAESQKYFVHLFMNQLPAKISIDSFVPVLKDRKEPVFISDSKELWPMLLQKGLAKAHGSYSNLARISPMDLTAEMTGFPTREIPLSDNPTIFDDIDNFSNKGYFMLLQGSSNSEVEQFNGKCFAILNCFRRGDKKMLLVNCPFVDNTYNGDNEPLPLKLLRSHHAAEGQMCAWFDEQGLMTHFDSLIVSATLPNLERASISFKAQKLFHFKFRVATRRDDNILIQLVDNTTNKVYNIDNPSVFKCYSNDGSSKAHLKANDAVTQGVARIATLPGDYIVRIELPQNEAPIQGSTMTLIMWSAECTQPQFSEETQANIKWGTSSSQYFKQMNREQSQTDANMIGVCSEQSCCDNDYDTKFKTSVSTDDSNEQ